MSLLVNSCWATVSAHENHDSGDSWRRRATMSPTDRICEATSTRVSRRPSDSSSVSSLQAGSWEGVASAACRFAGSVAAIPRPCRHCGPRCQQRVLVGAACHRLREAARLVDSGGPFGGRDQRLG